MESVSLAWETGDYLALRRLLHPQGSWVFVSTSLRTFLDPDALVDAIRHEQERTSYKLYTVSHESLGGTIVLAGAYIRASVGTTGHRRDGLFFRSEYFHSAQEARAALDAGWGSEELSSEQGLIPLGIEQRVLSA